MEFSKYLLTLAPSVTLQVTAKAKELKAKGEDVLGFAAGEPDFDTPDFIKNAAIKALNNGLTKYTPATGTNELKEAIVNKFRVDNGLEYEANQIIVSNGAKHSLFNAFAAILNEGDEVLIPTPYWVSYPEMVKSLGGVPVFVDSTIEEDFKVTVADLESAVTSKTKVLVINSPSNPTGSVYSKKELSAIADFAVAKNLIVISDEIYEKLLYDGVEHISIASFNDKIKALTITINGMSKAFSMTGWRLGYLAAPANIAKMISAFQSHTTSNPTSFSQAGGVEALVNPKSKDAVANMLATFDKRRQFMFDRLRSMKGVKPSNPKGAFYLFCDISGTGMDSLDFASKLLEEQKVAVVPGAAFGAPNCIRLSFATSDELIAKGMDRMSEWLS